MKSKKNKKTKRAQHNRVRLRSTIHLTRLNIVVGGICAFFLFIGFAALFMGTPASSTTTTPAYLEKYEQTTKTGNGSKKTAAKSASTKSTANSGSKGSNSSSYSTYDGTSYGTSTHSGTKTTIVATNRPAKALVVSPSSITIYKNSNGAKGVKSNVTSTAIQISSSDGQPINEPSVTNGPISATDNGNNASRATWAIETSAGNASLGGYTISFTSSSPSGTVYTGSLTVNVAAVPAFSLATSNVNAIVRIGATNTATFTGLSYDAGTSGGAAPTITAANIEGGNITCSSGLSYNASEIVCTDPNISRENSNTTIPMAFTFQNQYQLLTVGGNLIFTNSSNF